MTFFFFFSKTILATFLCSCVPCSCPSSSPRNEHQSHRVSFLWLQQFPEAVGTRAALWLVLSHRAGLDCSRHRAGWWQGWSWPREAPWPQPRVVGKQENVSVQCWRMPRANKPTQSLDSGGSGHKLWLLKQIGFLQIWSDYLSLALMRMADGPLKMSSIGIDFSWRGAVCSISICFPSSCLNFVIRKSWPLKVTVCIKQNISTSFFCHLGPEKLNYLNLKRRMHCEKFLHYLFYFWTESFSFKGRT